MSKKERAKWEYKINLRKLDLKKLEKIDKLVGKAGIVIGVLLLLLSIIVVLARGGV